MAVVEIYTINDLQNINLDLTADYLLMNDIDASDTINWNNGQGFNPLGTAGIDQFTGTFDGQGFTISNLHIVRDQDQLGLFGEIRSQNNTGGIVKNLNIKNAYVENTQFKLFTAILAGSNSGIIENCHVDGTVETNGGSGAGGLAGFVQNFNTLIKQSSSDATLNSNGFSGQIAGFVFGGLITKSSAKGIVNAPNAPPNNPVGGAFGSLINGSCVNCFSTAEVIGSTDVGGFVGRNQTTIENCYSIGSVTGDGSNFEIGGFCNSGSGNAINCFWDINTSGQTGAGQGVGLPTQDMQKLTTFDSAGWDIVEISDPNAAFLYPLLDTSNPATWTIPSTCNHPDVWSNWDDQINPPVPCAVRTNRGWEIPLKGTDPEKGLTELIVAISTPKE